MILQIVAIAVPALPTLLAIFAGIRKTDQRLGCAGVALGFLLGISPMGTYFAWQLSIAWAVAYLVATWLAAFRFAFWLLPEGSGSFFSVVVLMVWLAAVATLLPFAILPYFRVSVSDLVDVSFPKPDTSKQVELASIRDSVLRIQTSVAGMTTEIEQEQSRIRTATEELLKELDRRGILIRQLEHQRNDLAVRVREQQALASLSEEQVEAVRKDLTRGKYFEYLVGFVLGVASSITASVIGRLLGQKWAG